MGKLVRDRIPEIIRQSGRTSHVTTVDEQTYRKALHDKLLEERKPPSYGWHSAAVIDEFADVFEVVVALAATYDVTLDTITKAARRKRAERGGFEMRDYAVGRPSQRRAPSRCRGYRSEAYAQNPWP